MKTRLSSFHRPTLATAATLLLLAVLPTRAHALFTFTLSQVGANVVITGSGTLNTTALTLGNTSTQNPSIFPGFGGLLSGPANSSTTSYTGLNSPGGLGNGGPTDATSGTGSFVGAVSIANTLYVPASYVSGSALTNTSTYANSTISSLGFTPGTYTYTWGTGATADSLIVNVPTGVPEPSTWAAVAAGAGLLGFAALRRRRAALASTLA